MKPKIFISHSNQDTDLVDQIGRQIEVAGGVVYLAVHDPIVAPSLAGDILDELRSSHAMVVLLTKYGADSNYVQQEIGAALERGIRVIALVTREVARNPGQLAMLIGAKWIPLDMDEPQDAMMALTANISELSGELHAAEIQQLSAVAAQTQQELQARINSQRQAMVALGIFAGALLIVLLIVSANPPPDEFPQGELDQ